MSLGYERGARPCVDCRYVIVQNGLLRCDEVTDRAPSTMTDSRLVMSSASDMMSQSTDDLKSCATSSDVTSTVSSQLPCPLQCHNAATDPLPGHGNKSMHDDNDTTVSNCDCGTSGYCAL